VTRALVTIAMLISTACAGETVTLETAECTGTVDGLGYQYEAVVDQDTRSVLWSSATVGKHRGEGGPSVTAGPYSFSRFSRATPTCWWTGTACT
jgi:hypothetical protein